jgi:hypothetical protein
VTTYTQTCDNCRFPKAKAELSVVVVSPTEGYLICFECYDFGSADPFLEAARVDLAQDRLLAQVIHECIDQEAAVNDDIDNEPPDDWQQDGRRSADGLGRVLVVAAGLVALATAATLLAVAIKVVAGWGA